MRESLRLKIIKVCDDKIKEKGTNVGLSFYGWWPGLEGARGMWFAMVVSLSIVGLLLLRRLAQHMREFNAQGENQITL